MKNLLCSIALLAACSSCAHIPAPVRDFAVCLNTEISPHVADIISEVESALASGDFVALLTSLGKRVGFSVVDCAVNEVMGNSSARLSKAPGDELSTAKLSHGAEWLERK